MSQEIAIHVANVSKAYRIWNDPGARLKAPLLHSAARVLPARSALRQRLQRKAAAYYRDFYALKDIAFEVRKGESVGIIGRNGSGKSTLLQIIAGTLQPTTGAVTVRGRVAALLELGSGFNPEFTGRENVFLSAAVLGLTRAETEAKFDAIAAFADIGDFLDQPIKTYSSGMMVRLAFAVQTAVEPDILIVDEALSVGDFFFQQKCFARIRALAQAGTTLLFVSHDMSTVRDLCSRCLVLAAGRTAFLGHTAEALGHYFRGGAASRSSRPDGIPTATNSSEGRQARSALLAQATWTLDRSKPVGESPIQIEAVRIGEDAGGVSTTFPLGATALVEVLCTAREHGAYLLSLSLRDKYERLVTCQGTYNKLAEPVMIAAAGFVIVRFHLSLQLEAGLYSISLGAGRPGEQPNRSGGPLCEVTNLGPINVTWDYEQQRAPFFGPFGLPCEIDICQ